MQIKKQSLRKDIHECFKQGDILGASIFSSTYVANGALTRKEVSAMWAVKLKYHFRIKFALQLEILLRNDNPEYVASLEEKLMLAEKNFNIVAGGAIKTAPTGEALFTRRQVLEISDLAADEFAELVRSAPPNQYGAHN